MVLKLYGLDGSQPFRSTKWLLMMKGVPFEEVFIRPGAKSKGGSRSPEFLKINPAGTIPVMEEDDGK